MAYILNIETATKNCSVAVAKNGTTLLCKESATQGYSHAELLHVFIEQLLIETELSFKDIAAVAISQGPGSYTGLRIGVSAAKGLCFALNIPLIAVDTLEVLAYQIKIQNGWIVPMIDARRMEVYSTIFNSKLERIRAVEAEIINENSFLNTDQTLYFIGDCQEKVKTVLTKDNFIFLEEVIYPSATQMEILSFEKFKKRETEDVAYFEPYYLKDFVVTKAKNNN